MAAASSPAKVRAISGAAAAVRAAPRTGAVTANVLAHTTVVPSRWG